MKCPAICLFRYSVIYRRLALPFTDCLVIEQVTLICGRVSVCRCCMCIFMSQLQGSREEFIETMIPS